MKPKKKVTKKVTKEKNKGNIEEMSEFLINSQVELILKGNKKNSTYLIGKHNKELKVLDIEIDDVYLSNDVTKNIFFDILAKSLKKKKFSLSRSIHIGNISKLNEKTDKYEDCVGSLTVDKDLKLDMKLYKNKGNKITSVEEISQERANNAMGMKHLLDMWSHF